ncbi:MAG TPA: PP2C family protein-serine/threonine phosphatase [Terriglobales bacterium]|jgi:serine phosphatase RsbU (regulator of sigma subunit)|nr:PP2C family protein-serine/threonine phosphatase [Terriglobales bacterium]
MAAHPIELPGLLGWVSSIPFGQAASGGDVHYLSVCSKGQVSRIVLADVAGHGESVSAVAERLRQVLRHHTDNWDQSALMRELNEAFQRGAQSVQFATAVVLGFYCVTGELLFTNAGHPPPLWHHAESRVWDWLEERTPYAKDVDGLPLGLISGTAYAQTAVELRPGDVLLLYTDGITESRNESEEELGLEGLLELVRGVPIDSEEGPAAFGPALIEKLKKFRGSEPQRDDETLVLLQRARTPSEPAEGAK